MFQETNLRIPGREDARNGRLFRQQPREILVRHLRRIRSHVGLRFVDAHRERVSLEHAQRRGSG